MCLSLALEIIVCMCKSAVSSTCGIFLECFTLKALFHGLSVDDLDPIRLLRVFLFGYKKPSKSLALVTEKCQITVLSCCRLDCETQVFFFSVAE